MTGGLSPAMTAALIETGDCWHLSYLQSMELDDESKACGMEPPRAHWRVQIIISTEDVTEGWGDTPDEAAADALSERENPSDVVDVPLHPTVN